MSVLAEAMSVVIPNSVLKRLYPGGVAGLARECPAESFCTDGVLSRVGFLARKDADYFMGLLDTAGLRIVARGVCVDAALIDQNRGPLAPCLWIEFGRERNGTPVVWHAASRRGTLHVPEGWRPRMSLDAARFAGRPFAQQVQYLRRESNLDWYHDRSTNKVFSTPHAFPLH